MSKWLTHEEQSKVEAWLDSGDTPRGKYGAYYRLFISICLESGLRETEIVGGTTTKGERIIGLTHNQANPADEKWEGVLRLKRKDRPRFDAYLGPRTGRIYRELFLEETEPETEVFAGGPTVNDCYKFCRRLGNRLGIHLTPFRFRHNFAKCMILAGRSPSEIQEALGHQFVGMALLYFEALDWERLRESIHLSMKEKR